MKNSSPHGNSRLKDAAINLAIVCVSLVIGYVLLGIALLAYGPSLAWKVTDKFPTAATIPWQASGPKNDSQPYIAILGDSYAAGIGDWNVGRHSRSDPFYSGDVISEKLNRAVLSFGKSGSSNVRGLVTNPAHVMNAGSCMLMESPTQPSEIVIYIYEGNDFNDNLKKLKLPIDEQVPSSRIKNYIDQKAASMKDVSCFKYINLTIYRFVKIYVKILRGRNNDSGKLEVQTILLDGRQDKIPGGLQGPALELGELGLDTSFEVLSQSLDHLIQQFSGIPILVVNVPSVLTPYKLVGETVSISLYHDGNPTHPSAAVAKKSDYLCKRLREMALRKGTRFFDARPALKNVAMREKIHGPLDWKHLNKIGQTVLGSTVATAIDSGAADSGCAILATAS